MTLEETVNELAPRVLRYCIGRTGCPGLAEDAAQDALVALVQRWRRAGPPEVPEAFVFTIARRRLAREHVKRRLLAPLGLAERRASSEEKLDQKVENAEQMAATYGALRTLAPRDREVLLLTAAAELDQKTIASLLGISVSGVKMRLHRARQRLMLRLEEAHDAA
jgi:RNA polymerase sigma-70 factor (ECF subfamily)